ncbi:unnamed protein product, partial [Linum tenue]
MTRPGIKDGERYLYFFEKGNLQITINMIQDLVELITDEMQSNFVLQIQLPMLSSPAHSGTSGPRNRKV